MITGNSAVSRLRQLSGIRIPFAGLFLAACAGIVLVRLLPAPGFAFYAMFAGTSLAALVPRAGVLVWPGVALAFAAVQVWQTSESPAARLAAALDQEWRVVQAEFTVLDEPVVAPHADRQRVHFQAGLGRMECEGSGLPSGCRVTVEWFGEPPAYGDRIQALASARNIPPTRNPGQFDYAGWLAANHILSEIRVNRALDARVIGSDANPLVAFALRARGWMEQSLARGIETTPEASVIRAMTVGDTSGLSRETDERFREIGVYHLFSVSGLHVGMIALLLWGLLGTTGIPRRRVVLILIPLLFFYALITGLKPASVRAAIMVSVIAAGLVIDRRAVPLNSIGAAGFLILLFDTNELFNPGFQLSFIVVSAILILALPIHAWIDRRLEPDPFLPRELVHPVRQSITDAAKAVGGLLAVSAAAWIGSLPLILCYFHLISLAAIPANLLAVPLAFAVLSLSMLSLIVGSLSAWLGVLVNNANFLVAKLMLWIVGIFAALPGSYFYVGLPGATPSSITVFDAGRGGAAALQFSGKTWLIDGGSGYAGESVLFPFLRERGVNALDGAILTHGDSNHIGGFEFLFATFPPRITLDSGLPNRSRAHRQLLAQMAERSQTVMPAKSGDAIEIAPGVRLRILYPPEDGTGILADDKAIVLRLDAGAFRALFLSDSGFATEEWLLAHSPEDLRCDVLIKGQHISGNSGGIAFLQAAAPTFIVATAADFPKAEKIDPAWAAKLRDLGITLVPQSVSGAVEIRIGDGGYRLIPFLNPKEPLIYTNKH